MNYLCILKLHKNNLASEKLKYSKIFRFEAIKYIVLTVLALKISQGHEPSEISMQRSFIKYLVIYKVPLFCVQSQAFYSPLTPDSEKDLKPKSTFTPLNSSEIFTMLEVLFTPKNLPVQELLVT